MTIVIIHDQSPESIGPVWDRTATPESAVQQVSAVQHALQTGLQVIKLFSCSTQLSMKFILLMNVKMPTTVGILILISMINTTSERFKARNLFICRYYSFYEHLKFCAHLS